MMNLDEIIQSIQRAKPVASDNDLRSLPYNGYPHGGRWERVMSRLGR